MNRKVSAKATLVVLVLYLVVSIIASLLASIFFGGIRNASVDRVINGVIDSEMIANFLVKRRV